MPTRYHMEVSLTETPLDRDPPDRSPWTETPPSVNRLTDRCEIITLPQLRCGPLKKTMLNDINIKWVLNHDIQLQFTLNDVNFQRSYIHIRLHSMWRYLSLCVLQLMFIFVKCSGIQYHSDARQALSGQTNNSFVYICPSYLESITIVPSLRYLL